MTIPINQQWFKNKSWRSSMPTLRYTAWSPLVPIVLHRSCSFIWASASCRPKRWRRGWTRAAWSLKDVFPNGSTLSTKTIERNIRGGNARNGLYTFWFERSKDTDRRRTFPKDKHKKEWTLLISFWRAFPVIPIDDTKTSIPLCSSSQSDRIGLCYSRSVQT